MTSQEIKKLLDPYDGCDLECDGFSRIAGYLLMQNGVSYKTYKGWCCVGGKYLIIPHFWIEADDLTIDYRLGVEGAPHGVFKQSDRPIMHDWVSYEKECEIVLDCNATLFEILTMPNNVPDRIVERLEQFADDLQSGNVSKYPVCTWELRKEEIKCPACGPLSEVFYNLQLQRGMCPKCKTPL